MDWMEQFQIALVSSFSLCGYTIDSRSIKKEIWSIWNNLMFIETH